MSMVIIKANVASDARLQAVKQRKLVVTNNTTVFSNCALFLFHLI